MKKTVIAIVAYNEEKNISALIKKILNEPFSFTLFIYTDGSTDMTPSIVSTYQRNYPTQIQYIRGQKKQGKNHALNVLLPKIQRYKTAILLDADIDLPYHTLATIHRYLTTHKNLSAISPLLLPHTEGLGTFEHTIARLYSKARIHAFTYGRHKYISPRCFCVRTCCLVPIPAHVVSEDFYLNLHIPYDQLAICMDATAYYRRPSTIMDLIRYNARLGKGLASIHRHYPQLWTDQSKRVSIADYAVFDLTRYKFKIFFSKLATWEKAIFILTRLLSIVSMYEGFYMYRYTPEQAVWNPIKSTKIAFSESSS